MERYKPRSPKRPAMYIQGNDEKMNRATRRNIHNLPTDEVPVISKIQKIAHADTINIKGTHPNFREVDKSSMKTDISRAISLIQETIRDLIVTEKSSAQTFPDNDTNLQILEMRKKKYKRLERLVQSNAGKRTLLLEIRACITSVNAMIYDYRDTVSISGSLITARQILLDVCSDLEK